MATIDARFSMTNTHGYQLEIREKVESKHDKDGMVNSLDSLEIKGEGGRKKWEKFIPSRYGFKSIASAVLPENFKQILSLSEWCLFNRSKAKPVEYSSNLKTLKLLAPPDDFQPYIFNSEISLWQKQFKLPENTYSLQSVEPLFSDSTAYGKFIQAQYNTLEDVNTVDFADPAKVSDYVSQQLEYAAIAEGHSLEDLKELIQGNLTTLTNQVLEIINNPRSYESLTRYEQWNAYMNVLAEKIPSSPLLTELRSKLDAYRDRPTANIGLDMHWLNLSGLNNETAIERNGYLDNDREGVLTKANDKYVVFTDQQLRSAFGICSGLNEAIGYQGSEISDSIPIQQDLSHSSIIDEKRKIHHFVPLDHTHFMYRQIGYTTHHGYPPNHLSRTMETYMVETKPESNNDLVLMTYKEVSNTAKQELPHKYVFELSTEDGLLKYDLVYKKFTAEDGPWDDKTVQLMESVSSLDMSALRLKLEKKLGQEKAVVVVSKILGVQVKFNTLSGKEIQRLKQLHQEIETAFSKIDSEWKSGTYDLQKVRDLQTQVLDYRSQVKAYIGKIKDDIYTPYKIQIDLALKS